MNSINEFLADKAIFWFPSHIIRPTWVPAAFIISRIKNWEPIKLLTYLNSLDVAMEITDIGIESF